MNHYTFCKLLYVLYTPFQMLKMKLQGVKTDDRTFQQDALLAYLSSHLEAYRVPKIIEVVSKLHRTYNGKLDRKQYC